MSVSMGHDNTYLPHLRCPILEYENTYIPIYRSMRAHIYLPRQLLPKFVVLSPPPLPGRCCVADVSRRQHMSAYVSIRQHTSAAHLRCPFSAAIARALLCMCVCRCVCMYVCVCVYTFKDVECSSMYACTHVYLVGQ